MDKDIDERTNDNASVCVLSDVGEKPRVKITRNFVTMGACVDLTSSSDESVCSDSLLTKPGERDKDCIRCNVEIGPRVNETKNNSDGSQLRDSSADKMNDSMPDQTMNTRLDRRTKYVSENDCYFVASIPESASFNEASNDIVNRNGDSAANSERNIEDGDCVTNGASNLDKSCLDSYPEENHLVSASELCDYQTSQQSHRTGKPSRRNIHIRKRCDDKENDVDPQKTDFGEETSVSEDASLRKSSHVAADCETIALDLGKLVEEEENLRLRAVATELVAMWLRIIGNEIDSQGATPPASPKYGVPNWWDAHGKGMR